MSSEIEISKLPAKASITPKQTSLWPFSIWTDAKRPTPAFSARSSCVQATFRRKALILAPNLSLSWASPVSMSVYHGLQHCLSATSLFLYLGNDGNTAGGEHVRSCLWVGGEPQIGKKISFQCNRQKGVLHAIAKTGRPRAWSITRGCLQADLIYAGDRSMLGE